METVIAAAGRLRRGPLKELFDEYVARLGGTVTLREIEERGTPPPDVLKRREGELLLAALPKKAFVVALDERGKQYSSRAFARQLASWRERGGGTLAFVIGGAEGLHGDVVAAADAVLSLGPMTWPHMIARCLLAEQLYRAQTIAAGHPYHRE